MIAGERAWSVFKKRVVRMRRNEMSSLFERWEEVMDAYCTVGPI